MTTLKPLFCRPYAAALACFAFASAPMVNAATITTFAEADWEGIFVSDPQGPANSGTLISSADANGGSATALQTAAGVAAVRATGGSANGELGNTLVARSTWSETFTNNSAVGQQYIANLSIPQIILALSDGTSFAPSDRLEASYSIALKVDDAIVFSSEAFLRSGNPGHELFESGVDLGGVLTGPDVEYTFAPFSAGVNLGVFAPNSIFVVTYTIESAINIPGFEVFAESRIGDPINIDGTSIDITASPVPVPGALGLLFGGIAGLSVMRRRPAV